MSDQDIQLHDLTFSPYISAETLGQAVERVASELTEEYELKNPLLVGVLNGAFMFMADLSRSLNFDHAIDFVKLSSYKGTRSTGTVRFDLKLQSGVKDRDIIIVEDIVDTGLTMKTFREYLFEQEVRSVAVASLLFKKELFEYDYPVEYVGLEIPPVFIVGYGLDYNGLGRNLPMLYKKI